MMEKQFGSDLQREVLISDGNKKYVDSSYNMVGLKKNGNPVTYKEFKAVLESKGLSLSLSNNYRRA